MSNSKTFNKNKKSAFTLIELSIVLIIIGLLVAGVTGGASLIRSAQLRSVMSEARGFSVAVNSFVVQYDSLPGDYATIISGTIPSVEGDGDGLVEYVAGQGVGNGSIREGQNAWFQLINSGTIDEASLIVDADTLAPATAVLLDVDQLAGTHMPDSRLDGVGWMFTNSTDGNVIVATGTIAVDITTAEGTTLQNFTAVGAITPTDSLSIDTKLDDGLSDSGRVQGSALLGTPANCFAGDTYATGTATEECALEFTIDIS